MKWLLNVFCLSLICVSAVTMANSDLRAVVKWDGGSATVEVAETFEQRQEGLQNRKSMCADCGMLFLFQKERVVNFWMKNTYIPLDIAYIAADGKIKSIKPLEPENLKTVSSRVKVKYALEMNRGWFESKGIKAGDKLSFAFVADYDRVKQATH